ncbi:MAG TPA: Wzz/FepE/Etk N-terminal domain-containing protein [Terriglobales bacterium]|nr:Wzz/FepE/Etk N-terminal domain-containing protein [Terriglobales bacterium]
MAKHQELTFDDYLAILRRRRWQIIISTILGAVAGYLLSLALPNFYTSRTLVLVEQPTVPDSYVKAVVSEGLNQRLASMQEQILSRTRLQHLVEQFGLYKEDARRVPMEKLVERLRKSIKVRALNPMPGTRSQEMPGFYVEVTLGEARLAQRICAEILSMFMEQNSRVRQQQAEETTQFLTKQLDEAKAKLDDQDAKLAAFQRRYTGELPEHQQTSLTLLMSMTPQLETVTQALNQARQEKTFTESLLNQQLAAGKQGQNLEQQLSSLQNLLLSLQTRYSDQHPDVIKCKNDIAQLQKKIQEESARDQAQLSEQEAKAPVIETPPVRHLRAQLQQIEQTISQKKYDQEQMQRQINLLQSRVQLSPTIEQEFKTLTRDYQTALDLYTDLLKKRDQSRMASELERRQQGGQFHVLDAPSLPERPSFPNRPLFGLGGLGVGLAVGLGLAHLAESHDKSMRTARDVGLYLGVPTLALIPSFEPAKEKKNIFRHVPAERPKPSLHTSS